VAKKRQKKGLTFE